MALINFLYFFRKGLFAGMKLKKKKKGEKGLTIANKDALGKPHKSIFQQG